MNYKWVAEDDVPSLIDEKKFLLNKLLMWLPGIGFAFLICCLCIIMPFGSPVMNIPYMCFIAGYGILMLILYLKHKVKGINGNLPIPTFKCKIDKRNLVICLVSSISICFFVWYILYSSM